MPATPSDLAPKGDDSKGDDPKDTDPQGTDTRGTDTGATRPGARGGDYLRGASVEFDRAKAVRIVVGVALVALAALTVILTISAVNDNSRANRLRNHGVLVTVRVTSCFAVASGTGETIYGYACTGSFTIDGRPHTAPIRGNKANLHAGAIITGITDPSDPSILSTVAAAHESRSSWTPFISPGIPLVLLIAGLALVAWWRRRARTHPASSPTAIPTEPAVRTEPALAAPAPPLSAVPMAEKQEDEGTSRLDSGPGHPSPLSAASGLAPIVLEGDRVRLEPLGPEHIDGLVAAAALDRSSYGFTSVPQDRDDMAAYVAAAQQEWAAGRCLPFAVIDRRDGSAVGATRIWDWAVLPSGVPPSDRHPPNVSEIGHTWYGHAAQRTGINVEAKLLLLTYLFETWPGVRVTLKTDARNERSLTAIRRLGAHYEGVRRAHIPAADGTIRDSAYFSILAAEWPITKTLLLSRLH